MLEITPAEIIFDNVRPTQIYKKTLYVRNTLDGDVQFSVRPGTPQRYEISPQSVTLPPGATCELLVTVHLQKPLAARRIAGGSLEAADGRRFTDFIHLKSQYFAQSVSCTIIKDPNIEDNQQTKPNLLRKSPS
eukprot:TRINITY_DN21614_c0_g1::TRINITY_DN21614_c0_g1_i1::g.15005::m.15005 TRINITY_DN21614_c0_g1::TRINITY_DN21614_c0_g1_i1::g.15005  ORF type:complete len:133 (-),score=3.48,Motile_Sperm/PF00635.21/9.3e-07,PapD-like/PF14874.1/0.017,DUF1034/PF06280.7/0.057 TRINITY_DN21614_c0_g1_i1:169-567(-)